jgi:hypothetical protein
MGRYKLGPQGTYYDPNDTGPDQASTDQVQQYQQAQPSGVPNPGGSTMNTGGVTGYGPGGMTPPSAPNLQPSPQFPGNPNLPGYGDLTTSNPWRDSLTYREIQQASGMPSFQQAFQNAGANPQGGGFYGIPQANRPSPLPKGWAGLIGLSNVGKNLVGASSSAPQGGIWRNVFGSLGRWF